MQGQVCSRTGSSLCGIGNPELASPLWPDIGPLEIRAVKPYLLILGKQNPEGLGGLATAAPEVKSRSEFKGSNPRSLCTCMGRSLSVFWAAWENLLLAGSHSYHLVVVPTVI